jgi:hypothetical protein
MSSSLRSRALRLSAVAFGFGLLLAFVPVPAVQFATQSVGATESLPSVRPMQAEERAAAQAQADTPITGDRVVGADAAADRFTAIGFTFDRQPSQPVLVRVKRADGTFGDWTHLESEDAEGPDQGSAEGRAGRHGTAPLWVGSSTGYEVSLAPSDAASADVVTVHDVEHRSTVVAEPVAGAAVAPPFGIHLRSAWGARAATSTSYGSTVKLAVVHHSASPNTYAPADVPGVLRSIQAYHMDGRGWSDIAYNFVVDKFGGIWEGRGGGIDRPVIGAHAMGFNTNTVGVMVIGDYTLTGPSAAALESVSRVIGWKLALYNNSPSGRVDFTSGGSPKYAAGVTVNLPRVVGHTDVGSTDCPGSIEGSMSFLRSRSTQWFTFVRAASVPVGVLESLTATSGQVVADGFAYDPAADAPATVRLTVDDRSTDVLTTVARPDIQAQWPSYGAIAGFHAAIGGVAPGWHRVTVTVLGKGLGNTVLGRRDLVMADPSGHVPVGSVTGLSAFTGGFTVAGSVRDPDSAGPVTVDVQLNGQTVRTLTAGAGVPFSTRVAGIVGGSRLLCLRVRNVGAGADTNVSCRDLTVPAASPRGSFDVAQRTGSTITAWGWAVDDESVAPTFVILAVDDRWNIVWADQPRPGWERLFPDLGANHAWDARIPVGPGAHKVCATIRNVGGGVDTSLGCKVVK